MPSSPEATFSDSTDGARENHMVYGGPYSANSFKAPCQLSSVMLKCEAFSSIISFTAILYSPYDWYPSECPPLLSIDKIVLIKHGSSSPYLLFYYSYVLYVIVLFR